MGQIASTLQNADTYQRLNTSGYELQVWRAAGVLKVLGRLPDDPGDFKPECSCDRQDQLIQFRIYHCALP